MPQHCHAPCVPTYASISTDTPIFPRYTEARTPAPICGSVPVPYRMGAERRFSPRPAPNRPLRPAANGRALEFAPGAGLGLRRRRATVPAHWRHRTAVEPARQPVRLDGVAGRCRPARRRPGQARRPRQPSAGVDRRRGAVRSRGGTGRLPRLRPGGAESAGVTAVFRWPMRHFACGAGPGELIADHIAK
jgi:hypothetical protein